MEADWEFEVGGDAPVIDAHWAEFVDLQLTPTAAWKLAEAQELPALAAVLERLNLPTSGVWTSKCDFFPALATDEFDPDELDADKLEGGGSCLVAVGCYIDLLSKNRGAWSEPSQAETACRQVCDRLRRVALRCCRVDLIIRRTVDVADSASLGITAYITACGSGAADARDMLSSALGAFADAFA